MTTGYGISGIGYPLTGLGNYGLSPMSPYASYDNYMLGMMPGYGAMDQSIFNLNSGYGYNTSFGMNTACATNPMMYGMYNPLYMGQMMSQMEQNQLAHAGTMHTNLLNHQVQAATETDRALVAEMLTNASIQRGIDNLRQKVLEGDQDGICNEYDKLKEQIYRTYGDELKARGTEENYSTAAARLIENLYGSIVSAQTGQNVNLREDIQRYGKGAGTTGFMQGFRKGHHDRYVDETLYHCFGLDVDNKGSKDFSQSACKVGGQVASVLEKGAVGSAVAVGGTGIALGLGKAFTLGKYPASWLKTMGKAAPIAAVVGLGIGMIGDIIWKIADRDTATA